MVGELDVLGLSSRGLDLPLGNLLEPVGEMVFVHGQLLAQTAWEADEEEESVYVGDEQLQKDGSSRWRVADPQLSVLRMSSAEEIPVAAWMVGDDAYHPSERGSHRKRPS